MEYFEVQFTDFSQKEQYRSAYKTEAEAKNELENLAAQTIQILGKEKADYEGKVLCLKLRDNNIKLNDIISATNGSTEHIASSRVCHEVSHYSD